MQSLWSNAAGACVMSAPGAGTVSVTNPGRQSGTVGNRVSLQMRGSSSGGSSLTWTASGLPGGLSIGSATGLISGTLTRHGGYDVTVTATDQSGATGSASFTWTIKAKTVAGRPITGYAGKCLDDQNGNTASGGKAERRHEHLHRRRGGAVDLHRRHPEGPRQVPDRPARGRRGDRPGDHGLRRRQGEPVDPPRQRGVRA